MSSRGFVVCAFFVFESGAEGCGAVGAKGFGALNPKS